MIVESEDAQPNSQFSIYQQEAIDSAVGEAFWFRVQSGGSLQV